MCASDAVSVVVATTYNSVWYTIGAAGFSRRAHSLTHLLTRIINSKQKRNEQWRKSCRAILKIMSRGWNVNVPSYTFRINVAIANKQNNNNKNILLK